MSTATLAGCSQEGNESELDTAGPPRVTVVTLGIVGSTDPEVPAYCVESDADKISVVCLDAAGNYAFDETQPVVTSPTGFQVRLGFNELLDADRAEELVAVRDENGDPELDPYGNRVLRGTLERSQPVTLTCNGEPLAYDGYYNPSGNHLSLPPGPSLVVQPQAAAPTSATCLVEVVQGQSAPGFGVFDKGGNPVSAPDRGPFMFLTEALEVTGTAPAADVTGVALDVAPLVSFNAPLDPDTLSENGLGRVRLRSADDDVEVAVTLAVENGSTVRVTPVDALTPATKYELVVYGGIEDAAGGPALVIEAEPAVQSTFTTVAAGD